MRTILYSERGLVEETVERSSVVQSTLWTRHRKVVRESAEGDQDERGDHRNARSRENGHEMVSPMVISKTECRTAVRKGAVEIRGGIVQRAFSEYGRNIA